jgi:glycosyltransferase involved in cell wall biosynthesis
MSVVTVALPVLNGGPLLDEVLSAVRAQRVDAEVELLVADSGSTDGSVAVARRHGATVFEVDDFTHGGTRNDLATRANGSHVAFLTQDSTPAGDGWLAALLRGFERGPRVGLVYGPYRPRPDAPHWIRREYAEFFGTAAAVDPGPFFTDANGCVLREALAAVPFRPVSYAEDQMLARDMLAAGWAKVYEPDAAVIHSHSYGAWEQFGRHFDEFRALREVHGHVQEVGPRYTLGTLRREVARDRAFLRAEGGPVDRGTLESLRFHALRATAAALGTRADKLPRRVRGALSRDGRDSFEPATSARDMDC